MAKWGSYCGLVFATAVVVAFGAEVSSSLPGPLLPPSASLLPVATRLGIDRFVHLWELAELQRDLKQTDVTGSYTIFAPSDENIPDSFMLDSSDTNALEDFLYHHIVPGVVNVDNTTIVNLAGSNLRLTRSANDLFVNNAVLTGEDFRMPSNSIVHVIKGLLCCNKSKSLTPKTNQTISEMLPKIHGGTFRSMMQVSDCDSSLDPPGVYTVFVPTDAAFARLDPFYVEQLRGNNSQLRNVLLYHVVPGRFPLTELIDGRRILTKMGNVMFPNVQYTDGNQTIISVSGVKILQADIVAKNGIIHVVDRVIMEPPEGNTYDNLKRNKNIANFLELIERNNLTHIIAGKRPFTLFPPTNEIVRNFTALQRNPTHLLNYFIIGSHYLVSLMSLKYIDTLGGSRLVVQFINETLIIGGVPIREEILTRNGVIHPIEGVIEMIPLPPLTTTTSPPAIHGLPPYHRSTVRPPYAGTSLLAVGQPSGLASVLDVIQIVLQRVVPLRTFITSLLVTRIGHDLRTRGPFTVFAPIDLAFKRLNPPFFVMLITNNTFVRELLYNHLVPGRYTCADLAQRNSLTTIRGQVLKLQPTKDCALVNGAKIIQPDVMASNGIIHVVDHVVWSGTIPAFPQTTDLTDRLENLQSNITGVLLTKAGLLPLIQQGTHTLLSPTDSAWGLLPLEIRQELEWNLPSLRELLLFHLVPRRLSLLDLEDDKSLNTSAGLPAFPSAVTKQSVEVVIVGGASIVDPDKSFGQGIIHVVNKVMFPLPHGDVITTLASSPDPVQTMLTLLQMKLALLPVRPFTIFCPLDKAFDVFNLPLDRILQENSTILTDIIKGHIVDGIHYLAEFDDETSLSTLNGEKLTFKQTTDGVYVNGVPIISGDILCTNGVIHIIPYFIIRIGQYEAHTIIPVSNFTSVAKITEIGDKTTEATFTATEDEFATFTKPTPREDANRTVEELDKETVTPSYSTVEEQDTYSPQAHEIYNVTRKPKVLNETDQPISEITGKDFLTTDGYETVTTVVTLSTLSTDLTHEIEILSTEKTLSTEGEKVTELDDTKWTVSEISSPVDKNLTDAYGITITTLASDTVKEFSELESSPETTGTQEGETIATEKAETDVEEGTIETTITSISKQVKNITEEFDISNATTLAELFGEENVTQPIVTVTSESLAPVTGTSYTDYHDVISTNITTLYEVTSEAEDKSLATETDIYSTVESQIYNDTTKKYSIEDQEKISTSPGEIGISTETTARITDEDVSTESETRTEESALITDETPTINDTTRQPKYFTGEREHTSEFTELTTESITRETYEPEIIVNVTTKEYENITGVTSVSDTEKDTTDHFERTSTEVPVSSPDYITYEVTGTSPEENLTDVDRISTVYFDNVTVEATTPSIEQNVTDYALLTTSEIERENITSIFDNATDETLLEDTTRYTDVYKDTSTEYVGTEILKNFTADYETSEPTEKIPEKTTSIEEEITRSQDNVTFVEQVTTEEYEITTDKDYIPYKTSTDITEEITETDAYATVESQIYNDTTRKYPTEDQEKITTSPEEISISTETSTIEGETDITREAETTGIGYTPAVEDKNVTEGYENFTTIAPTSKTEEDFTKHYENVSTEVTITETEKGFTTEYENATSGITELYPEKNVTDVYDHIANETLESVSPSEVDKNVTVSETVTPIVTGVYENISTEATDLEDFKNITKYYEKITPEEPLDNVTLPSEDTEVTSEYTKITEVEEVTETVSGDQSTLTSEITELDTFATDESIISNDTSRRPKEYDGTSPEYEKTTTEFVEIDKITKEGERISSEATVSISEKVFTDIPETFTKTSIPDAQENITEYVETLSSETISKEDKNVTVSYEDITLVTTEIYIGKNISDSYDQIANATLTSITTGEEENITTEVSSVGTTESITGVENATSATEIPEETLTPVVSTEVAENVTIILDKTSSTESVDEFTKEYENDTKEYGDQTSPSEYEISTLVTTEEGTESPEDVYFTDESHIYNKTTKEPVSTPEDFIKTVTEGITEITDISTETGKPEDEKYVNITTTVSPTEERNFTVEYEVPEVRESSVPEEGVTYSDTTEEYEGFTKESTGPSMVTDIKTIYENASSEIPTSVSDLEVSTEQEIQNVTDTVEIITLEFSTPVTDAADNVSSEVTSLLPVSNFTFYEEASTLSPSTYGVPAIDKGLTVDYGYIDENATSRIPYEDVSTESETRTEESALSTDETPIFNDTTRQPKYFTGERETSSTTPEIEITSEFAELTTENITRETYEPEIIVNVTTKEYENITGVTSVSDTEKDTTSYFEKTSTEVPFSSPDYVTYKVTGTSSEENLTDVEHITTLSQFDNITVEASTSSTEENVTDYALLTTSEIEQENITSIYDNATDETLLEDTTRYTDIYKDTSTEYVGTEILKNFTAGYETTEPTEKIPEKTTSIEEEITRAQENVTFVEQVTTEEYEISTDKDYIPYKTSTDITEETTETDAYATVESQIYNDTTRKYPTKDQEKITTSPGEVTISTETSTIDGETDITKETETFGIDYTPAIEERNVTEGFENFTTIAPTSETEKDFTKHYENVSTEVTITETEKGFTIEYENATSGITELYPEKNVTDVYDHIANETLESVIPSEVDKNITVSETVTPTITDVYENVSTEASDLEDLENITKYYERITPEEPLDNVTLPSEDTEASSEYTKITEVEEVTETVSGDQSTLTSEITELDTFATDESIISNDTSRRPKEYDGTSPEYEKATTEKEAEGITTEVGASTSEDLFTEIPEVFMETSIPVTEINVTEYVHKISTETTLLEEERNVTLKDENITSVSTKEEPTISVTLETIADYGNISSDTTSFGTTETAFDADNITSTFEEKNVTLIYEISTSASTTPEDTKTFSDHEVSVSKAEEKVTEIYENFTKEFTEEDATTEYSRVTSESEVTLVEDTLTTDLSTSTDLNETVTDESGIYSEATRKPKQYTGETEPTSTPLGEILNVTSSETTYEDIEGKTTELYPATWYLEDNITIYDNISVTVSTPEVEGNVTEYESILTTELTISNVTTSEKETYDNFTEYTVKEKEETSSTLEDQLSTKSEVTEMDTSITEETATYKDASREPKLYDQTSPEEEYLSTTTESAGPIFVKNITEADKISTESEPTISDIEKPLTEIYENYTTDSSVTELKETVTITPILEEGNATTELTDITEIYRGKNITDIYDQVVNVSFIPEESTTIAYETTASEEIASDRPVEVVTAVYDTNRTTAHTDKLEVENITDAYYVVTSVSFIPDVKTDFTGETASTEVTMLDKLPTLNVSLPEYTVSDAQTTGATENLTEQVTTSYETGETEEGEVTTEKEVTSLPDVTYEPDTLVTDESAVFNATTLRTPKDFTGEYEKTSSEAPYITTEYGDKTDEVVTEETKEIVTEKYDNITSEFDLEEKSTEPTGITLPGEITPVTKEKETSEYDYGTSVSEKETTVKTISTEEPFTDYVEKITAVYENVSSVVTEELEKNVTYLYEIITRESVVPFTEESSPGDYENISTVISDDTKKVTTSSAETSPSSVSLEEITASSTEKGTSDEYEVVTKEFTVTDATERDVNVTMKETTEFKEGLSTHVEGITESVPAEIDTYATDGSHVYNETSRKPKYFTDESEQTSEAAEVTSELSTTEIIYDKTATVVDETVTTFKPLLSTEEAYSSVKEDSFTTEGYEVSDIYHPSATTQPDTSLATTITSVEYESTELPEVMDTLPLSTLKELLDKIGLTENITHAGPLTIFAPTDSAFDSLNNKSLQDLFSDQEQTADILLFHCAPIRISMKDMKHLISAPTLSGRPLFINTYQRKGVTTIQVNGVPLKPEEHVAGNSTIFLISQVLRPPSGDLTYVIENRLNLETLLANLMQNDLLRLLAGEGPFTLFAPNEKAWMRLPPNLQISFSQRPELLRDYLLSHIVRGVIYSSSFQSGNQFKTVNGKVLRIKLVGSDVRVNNGKIVQSDISATNGVVHIVDSVLIPLEEPLVTTDHITTDLSILLHEAETIPTSPWKSLHSGNAVIQEMRDLGLLKFAKLVLNSGFFHVLKSLRYFTIFAPSDEAFETIEPLFLDVLYANPLQLWQFLHLHVVNGIYYSFNITNGTMTTLNGDNLTALRHPNGQITVNGANLIQTDRHLLKGVLHVINNMIFLPEETSLETQIEQRMPHLRDAVRWLQQSQRLNGGSFTFFAPSGSAWLKATDDLHKIFKYDQISLTESLLNHICIPKMLSSSLVHNSVCTTLSGKKLYFKKEGQKLLVNGSRLLHMDIPCKNGVIHTVDAVFLNGPEAPSTEVDLHPTHPNGWRPNYPFPMGTFHPLYNDSYWQQPSISLTTGTFYKLLERAGVLERIKSGSYTLFAPTDSAFESFPLLEMITREPRMLRQLVLSHIIPGRASLFNIFIGASPITLSNLTLRFTTDKGSVFVNDSVILGKRERENGNQVFIVDKVLTSPNINTIRDIIRKDEKLFTLNTLIPGSHVEKELNEKGPFTLFLPTDSAFTTVSTHTLESLRNNQTAIREFISNIMLDGFYYERDLQEKTTLRTIGGSYLNFSHKGDKLKVNNAPIVRTNVTAANGIIHFVDKILYGIETVELVTTVAPPINKRDVDILTLAKTLNLTVFANFVNLTKEILEDLSQQKYFTIFVPSDEAFQALPPSLFQELQGDRKRLKNLLLYHMLPEMLPTNLMQSERLYDTLVPGKTVRLNSYNHNQKTKWLASGSPIIRPDNHARNGIIHVVQQVMYIPWGDLFDTIDRSAILHTLTNIIDASGLKHILKGKDSYTLFAPSDEALRELSPGLLKYMMKRPQLLKDFVWKHVVNGTYYSPSLLDRSKLTTLGDNTLYIRALADCYLVNNATILYPDVTAENGVVHVINQIL